MCCLQFYELVAKLACGNPGIVSRFMHHFIQGSRGLAVTYEPCIMKLGLGKA